MNFREQISIERVCGQKSLWRQALIVAACLCMIFFLTAWLQPAEAAPDSGSDDAVSFAVEESFSDLDQIRFPFLDSATVAYEWSFPYSDSFFRQPSDRFSRMTAQGSLGLAASAFRSMKNTVDPQYETYLKEAGFTHIESFGYDKPTTQDSLSGTIACKEIDDFTVIAAVTCGQGYGNEWCGNLMVGGGEVHEGFHNASQILEDHLSDYIKDQHIDGKKKLWLAGISRAAAIANLTAVDAVASGDYEDVYAYLYGVPRTTKEPVSCPGLYNICGQFDPITEAPLQSWGFERNGTDLYTPAQETDSDYVSLATAASKTSQKLAKEQFRNNPELNYQLHLILEFMGTFFPSNQEYADRFQELLMNSWQNHDMSEITQVLTLAISRMDDLNSQESSAMDVVAEYLTMLASQHTRANQRQIIDGSWNPNVPTENNVVLEHRPSTYVKWLFSDTDTKALLRQGGTTRRITIIGNINVEVWQEGSLLETIHSGENVSQTAEDHGKDQPLPFLMRNGSEVVVNIPTDAPYRLVLDVPKNMNLTYYDVSFQTRALNGEPGKMYLTRASKDRYAMDVLPGRDLSLQREASGEPVGAFPQRFDYSPLKIMKAETDAGTGAYMTVSFAVVAVSLVIFLQLFLLLICLIIFIVHVVRRRRGHGPFSPWFLIVPHVLFAMTFMLVTLMSTYYLSTVHTVRSAVAAAAVFCIFLLALRGLIRRRDLTNLLITAGLLILAVLTYFFYGSIPQETFTLANVILYCAFMAVLAAVATLTFYRPFKGKAGPAPAEGQSGQGLTEQGQVEENQTEGEQSEQDQNEEDQTEEDQSGQDQVEKDQTEEGQAEQDQV